MGKFDLTKIKAKKEIEQVENTSQVGVSLLNNESKKMAIGLEKTSYIPASEIEPNPRNRMSMDGIESLANLIKLSGLEQPLVVRQKDDGKYMILTGHRRYSAIKLLIERGEWNSQQLIECKVKDLDNLQLPLEVEDKEMLSILVTNQSRVKTDGDIAFEIEEWKKIISKLREKNVSVMVTGYDTNGDPIQREITGVRTKELVAEQLNVSPAQVAKFNKVENNGSDALKNALKKDKINISVASKVASMPVIKQDEFINNALSKKEEGEQITSDDLAIAEKHEEDTTSIKRKKSGEDLPKGLINDKVFKADIKAIQKAIKGYEEGCQLSESDYASYCRYITGLKKLFVS